MWTDGQWTDNRRQVITIAHPEPCPGELKKREIKMSSVAVVASTFRVKAGPRLAAQCKTFCIMSKLFLFHAI